MVIVFFAPGDMKNQVRKLPDLALLLLQLDSNQQPFD